MGAKVTKKTITRFDSETIQHNNNDSLIGL